VKSSAPWKVTLIALSVFALSLALAAGLPSLIQTSDKQLALLPFEDWNLTSAATSVAFSPDNQVVAVSETNGVVQLRKTSDGTLLETLTGNGGSVTVVSFSADGHWIASADNEGGVRLWSRTGAKSAQTVLAWVASTYNIRTMTFSADSGTLAAGAESGEIWLWSVPSGQLKATLHSYSGPCCQHQGAVLSMMFSPNGRSILVGSNDSVQQWDVTKATMQSSVADPQRTRTTNFVRSMAFSPDMQMVGAAYDGNPQVYLWNIRTGDSVRTLSGHYTDVWSMAFSPDGRFLATGSGSTQMSGKELPDEWDTSIRIWRAADGVALARLVGHGNTVRGLGWSSDGKLLASTGDDGTVKLWSVDF
jgi:WD40 repeat protein